jgi:hypothetical protein
VELVAIARDVAVFSGTGKLPFRNARCRLSSRSISSVQFFDPVDFLIERRQHGIRERIIALPPVEFPTQQGNRI